MQRSNHLLFSECDRLGWTRYGNLNLPPDIGALLYGSSPPSFDGHVPPASVPDAPSNARDFSSEGTGRGRIAVVDGRDCPPSGQEVPMPSVAPSVDSNSQHVQPPLMIPRRRLAFSGSRVCGQCRQPGHNRKSCPALGHAPLDFNRNATEVLRLAPHVPRRSAPAVQEVAAAASAEAPEPVRAASNSLPAPNNSDLESSRSSGGSQSVSDADDVAADGFDGVLWRLEFDSTLPLSDSLQSMCHPRAFRTSSPAQQRQ